MKQHVRAHEHGIAYGSSRRSSGDVDAWQSGSAPAAGDLAGEPGEGYGGVLRRGVGGFRGCRKFWLPDPGARGSSFGALYGPVTFSGGGCPSWGCFVAVAPVEAWMRGVLSEVVRRVASGFVDE